MIKQIINTTIFSLGIMATSGVAAHQTNEYFHIHLDQPHHYHNDHHRPHHRPHYRPNHQRCFSGHKINQRQQKQAKRIKRGIHKGQLTHWEVKHLKQQQQNIRHKERHFRHSGNCLTKAEVKKLNRLLNQASQNIKNKRHNQHYRHHNHNW